MNYLTKLYVWFSALLEPIRNRKGQTMAEYALMFALIAIVVIAAVSFLGNRAASTYSKVVSSF